MIRIRYFPIRFEQKNKKEYSLKFEHNKSLHYYLKKTEIPYLESNIIIAGRVVDNLEEILLDNTKIIITVKINLPALGAAIAFLWTALPYIAVAASIYMAVTMKKPSMPSYGRTGEDMENSPVYTFDGMRTTQSVGIPIGVVYGRHAVPGNKINEYIWTDGDKNYLNTLLVVSEGEIDGFESVLINENPSGNFDGITLAYRYGTNDQTVIPNFQDLHDINAVGVTLAKDNPSIYRTTLTDVEAFELRFTFPSGLYQQNSSTGSLLSMQVTINIYYKLASAPDYSYISAGTLTIDSKKRAALRRVFRQEGLTAGQYDIKIVKTSDDSSTYVITDVIFDTVDEIRTDDLAYPNVALASIRALATDQLSGSSPNYKIVIRGIKVSIPKVLTGIGGDAVDWEDYYWDPDAEVFKLFVGGPDLYWDTVTYETKWSANPIWCTKDFILNERYGLGNYISSTDVDDVVNLENALYSEERVSDGNGGWEKRFRLDVVIDSSGKALDILSQLATTFRAVILYAGGKVKIKIDKPEDPVQLFGMGNIIPGTYTETWKSKRDTYNMIEVRYTDASKGYVDETIIVMDQDAIAAGEPQRKKSVRIFATKLSYAIREGNFILRAFMNLKRTISFRANISALASMAFDVISFSHDVPQIGYSGKIKEGSTTSTIILDREVTIEVGSTYHILVYSDEDVAEERTVTNSPGTTATITVSVPFSSAPEKYNEYSFGVVNALKKDYRLVQVSREANYEVTLSAIEYNSGIYPDGDVVLPIDNYSALSNSIPPITNLSLTEGVANLPDGTVKTSIDVWFRKPDDTEYVNKYLYAVIYLSDDGGVSYAQVGTTQADAYSIVQDFVKTTTYYVKVVTFCVNGIAGTVTIAPSASIFIAGKIAAPQDVPAFNYSWGENLEFYWSAVTNTDLAGYEIRDENANWGTVDSSQIYQGLATKKTMYPASRAPGTYYLKAFNTSGIYSDTAASITPINAAPDAPTVSSTIWFGMATLDWEDSTDDDLLYYEIYKSETGIWVGEETLYKKVSGTQANLQGKESVNATVEAADATSITDSNLIGSGTNEFLGDYARQTSGTHKDQVAIVTVYDDTTGKITVASWPDGTPDIDDSFTLTDRAFFKVRGVDRQGAGSFSNLKTISFDPLSEFLLEDGSVTTSKLADEAVTAGKLYSGEIITYTAQIKNAIITSAKILSLEAYKIDVGILTGFTIRTSDSNPRVEMSEGKLRVYDDSNNLRVVLGDISPNDLKVLISRVTVTS